MDIENCNFYFSPQETFAIQIEIRNLRFHGITLDDNPFLFSKTVPMIKSHFQPILERVSISGSVMEFLIKSSTASRDEAAQQSQFTCSKQW